MADGFQTPVTGDAPDDLLAAFWEYERALMANDLEELDRLFAPGDATLRGDAAGLLVGHVAISEFRRGRGGSPARRVIAVEIRAISPDDALIVAVTAPATGGRGQQTQLWRRGPAGWAVAAAHVSLPAPAVSPAIWRVVGTPLVPAAADGPLAGHTVAVKDLFDVAGFPVGAGVPGFLAEADVAGSTASAVSALLDAGARVTGIAQTDEFAYSIAGRNAHYGTPPNPAVLGGIPGGSTSGPASAVALGQVSIGLGTDTGGSLRVPASYQGLWGLRTTHGAVDVRGLLPLAPSFDTIGWLTRDAQTLRAAAAASLDGGAQRPAGERYVVAPAFASVSEPHVRTAFERAIAATDGSADIDHIDIGDLDNYFDVFRTVQAAEAWRTHGAWITAHPGSLGDDIAARFAWASTISTTHETDARARLEVARSGLEDILGDRILLLPSTSSIAPSAVAGAETIERTRAGTLRLTCIAGITGRPALSVPVMTVQQSTSPLPAPLGLCLVGPRWSDLDLIARGERIARELDGHFLGG